MTLPRTQGSQWLPVGYFLDFLRHVLAASSALPYHAFQSSPSACWGDQCSEHLLVYCTSHHVCLVLYSLTDAFCMLKHYCCTIRFRLCSRRLRSARMDRDGGLTVVLLMCRAELRLAATMNAVRWPRRATKPLAQNIYLGPLRSTYDRAYSGKFSGVVLFLQACL